MARTMAALARYFEFRQRGARTEGYQPQAGSISVSLTGQRMSEAAAKAILARIGIPVTRDVLVARAEDVPSAFLRSPVAVKIASPDIAHKTDIGAVKLNVIGREALEAAVHEVFAAARQHAPGATLDGVIVSGMVTGGHELLAGAVNDPVFGPVVLLAAGGIFTEALNDRTCRIAPFGRETALEMVDELRCAAMLRGFRGMPAVDVGALAEILARLSWFAWENRETVAEVDINPLIATAQGVVAADALIVGR
jgi:acetyltransferase